MQKKQFFEAYKLARSKLTHAAIARKIGLKRQTVKGWDHLVRGPHEDNMKLFLDWYQCEVLLQDQRQGVLELLAKHKRYLPTSTYTIEWYDKDPEAWIEVNLPWLYSTKFYWGINKRGHISPTLHQGWIDREEDYRIYNRLVGEDRINELIGLALL